MERTPFLHDLIQRQAAWDRTYAALAATRPTAGTAELRRRLVVLSSRLWWHPFWTSRSGRPSAARARLRVQARAGGRHPDGGGRGGEDGPDDVGGAAYTDPRAPQDVAVTYTVEAVDTSGQRSGVSGAVDATRPVPGTAPKPSGLMARRDGNGVLVSWDGHSGDMGQSYRVYARDPDPYAWSFLAASSPRDGEVRVPGAGGLFYVVSVDGEGREPAPVYVGAY
ncbi:hypothetical protein [Streptomyces sp. NBC_00414]|uniref:hypothetical protein n=1 Tax=Streptomyces sp. NBC_00414 TaxID=2975739 RepID=UPI002E1B03AD